jgi:hypothetical protein
LPRFDKPTKLPTFKLPKYTGAQFRAASKTLQETPNAGEVVLANATGINPTTQQGAAALGDLKADLAKQGVQAAPAVEAEPVVEQEAEVLALPAPAVNVDRLRKAITKAMKGFGLNDVGLSLDYALKTAARDADGNLVYGIRPRREGDVDSMILGGEAGSGLFVKSDEIDPEGRAEAYYDPALNSIFLSIDKVMTDPSMTEAQVEAALLEVLDHEMIHAMRKLDLFTNKEFNLLSRAAANKKMPDGRTFLKWAQDNYSDLSPVDQVEESVAELVRAVKKDPKLLQGKPRSLVERIARFFRNMISALKGEKFNTFSEVIDAIGSGEIGARQRGQIRTFAETQKRTSRELKALQDRGAIVTTGEDAERPVPTATGQTVADFDKTGIAPYAEEVAAADVVNFSRRPKPMREPKNVEKAYKLFSYRDGQLYPLFVEEATPIPVGEWIRATDPQNTFSSMNKDGELELYVPASTGTRRVPLDSERQRLLDQGVIAKVDTKKILSVAYRPGFHSGDIPIAPHIGPMVDNKRKETRYRGDDQVWAEIEVPADVDWQSIANSNAKINKDGSIDVKTADVKEMPNDGYYRFKTNPTMFESWMVSGGIKVTKILTDKEAKAIAGLQGVSDLPRREGYVDPVEQDRAESPMFSRRPVERGGVEGNVSTRYPTGAKRTEDPLDDLLVNDYQTFVNDKTVFNKNMELIKDSNLYPILQKAANLRTNEQKAEAFVEAVKNNLLNLFDRVPAETRENSKLWYKGANALVRRFADRHGISMEQASAVAANLSPQKDWYQNASLAERTIDIYFDHANQPFTQAMKDRAEELFFHKGISAKAQAENRERLELIGSSTLSEVLRKFNEPGLGDTLAAMWIRTFDQTYHDPSYRIVSPDGRLLDYAKNADGSNSKVAWGSLVEIAKGVRALQNPDIDAISESLGSANKVRNFYNNIFDPDSDLGFVTIDTHAVAAGLLKPLGGSAFEVSHNFGTKGSSSKITGLNGVYSLYEEGYRRAANERGVLPREMQSITWEAVRGLFRPEYKSQKSNVDVVGNIWKQYNKKLITLDQAREAVYEHAQDINPPDWERSSGGIPEGDEASTYERKLPDSGVSRPRSESATGRGRGSNAARPLQTEDVALPFDLPESQKRRNTIGQSEVDRVVEDNLEVAENRPAGTVPRFNPGADPYSQAVAADPDKGQELTPSEMPSFSRANAPEINPIAQAALDNVVADLPTNTPGQTYLNVLDQGPIRKALTRFKQKAVNRYAQLENYQGVFGDLLADSSSMAAALMADRANAITAAALQYGVPVYTGGMTKIVDFEHTNSRGETQKIGGLIDLMSMLYTKEHGSLEQLAQAYSIAKRAERLKAKGIDVPGTPADHAANIATAESFLDENGNSIIKDWYDAWQDYNGYTVQFLQDTGVVDPETAEMWRDQSDYIPFYRQVEGAETPNAPNVFGGLTGSADLKAIKGSEKEINVPMLEAISMNLNAAISMGMKNVAQQRIVRDMRNIGLAREVKPGQRTAGEAVVTFKVDGNRRSFIIDDPLVYESLTVEPAGGVEREVAKIAGFPARLLREMVTREPGFVIANMLRDSLSAFVTSGSKFMPVIDTIFGYAEGMEKLERTGVVGGYDYKNDPENIGEYAGKILQTRNKNVDQRGLLAKTFGRAWDWMGQATTRSDAATRNAVYNDVLARTGNEAEASFQAMEVLNFGRRGSSPVMRLVTATIPFLNARIQGLDVLVRAGAGKNTANKELSRGQAAASFLARGGLIAASTAIYYTMVSDDEQYKEQTEEIKDNYWIIPTPSGVPVRIPIPFEVGLLFKTLPERIIDSYNDGTTAREAQQSAQRAVFGTLGVQPPQAITPIMEAFMNYDLYTGRPVTPVFIEGNLDPQFQELASTTEVAKNMSRVLGISPIKLDHLMNGYGGTIGSYLLGAVDYGLRDSRLQGDNRAVLAGTDVSQYPVIRRFFGSEFGGGAKEDFYEMWDYVKRVEQTAKDLYEDGRTEELENYLVNKRQFLGMRKQLQPTATLLADLRKQRRAILKADLSAAEKKEYMKLINEQEQYYLQIVPTLEKYIQLPSLTESVADRLSSLI